MTPPEPSVPSLHGNSGLRPATPAIVPGGETYEIHAPLPAWPTGPLLPPRAGAAGRFFHGDTN